MKMPPELSLPVQRLLRTMISGVMLVQCFTLYVYLASYVVLLYPVFLEERPTLVLPWLLLAALRKLLCELVSLALGLGTCVLLGPATPPCIKFVISKLASIMPAAYTWMLVYTYYHTLKVSSAFKTIAAVLPANVNDFGLELAVRRRRTKSLLGEKQLRKNLMADVYDEGTTLNQISSLHKNINVTQSSTSTEDMKASLDMISPIAATSDGTILDLGPYEDWYGSEIVIPRDTDRILEQFVIMLIRIGTYLKKGYNSESLLQLRLSEHFQLKMSSSPKVENASIPSVEIDTPPAVGSSKGTIATYLRDYPQIFMKKSSEIMQSPMLLQHSHSQLRLDNENRKQSNNLSRQKGLFLEKDAGKNETKDELQDNSINSYINTEREMPINDIINKHSDDDTSNHSVNNAIIKMVDRNDPTNDNDKTDSGENNPSSK